jgi:hypothetical protein
LWASEYIGRSIRTWQSTLEKPVALVAKAGEYMFVWLGKFYALVWLWLLVIYHVIVPCKLYNGLYVLLHFHITTDWFLRNDCFLTKTCELTGFIADTFWAWFFRYLKEDGVYVMVMVCYGQCGVGWIILGPNFLCYVLSKHGFLFSTFATILWIF